jgi:hypothetical protein
MAANQMRYSGDEWRALHPQNGRPAGSENRVTQEFKRDLQLFFSGEEYREGVKKRIINGSAPSVEIYFLQLIFGKPRDEVSVSVSVGEDLTTLSTEELARRAEGLLAQLRDAKELEELLAQRRNTIDVTPSVETNVSPRTDGEESNE